MVFYHVTLTSLVLSELIILRADIFRFFVYIFSYNLRGNWSARLHESESIRKGETAG